jgi:hypothetical protein
VDPDADVLVQVEELPAVHVLFDHVAVVMVLAGISVVFGPVVVLVTVDGVSAARFIEPDELSATEPVKPGSLPREFGSCGSAMPRVEELLLEKLVDAEVRVADADVELVVIIPVEQMGPHEHANEFPVSVPAGSINQGEEWLCILLHQIVRFITCTL